MVVGFCMNKSLNIFFGGVYIPKIVCLLGEEFPG